MGRLFDGVDAILENRAAARYEGEGAALLETLGAETERTPEALGPYRLAFYEEAGIRPLRYAAHDRADCRRAGGGSSRRGYRRAVYGDHGFYGLGPVPAT